MFLDLEKALADLKPGTTRERVDEFIWRWARGTGYPFVTAFGGFPIKRYVDRFMWCGSEVNAGILRQQIVEGLGHAGLLTYMDKSKLGLDRLGRICLQNGHHWGLHWMSLSILFVNYDLQAELAFARDSRFHLSWPVLKTPEYETPLRSHVGNRIFGVNGSLKDWMRYLKHKDDEDFDAVARGAMTDAAGILKEILPIFE